MLLGQVQVVRHFQHYRNLSGQSAGSANILLRDAGAVQPVEHAEHAEHASVGAQEGDGQQLFRLVLGDDLQIHASHLPEIVGPEDFPGPQCPRGDALGKHGIHTLRLTPIDGISNVELPVFEQGDKTSAETEKVGGANHEGLKKMFEVTART